MKCVKMKLGLGTLAVVAGLAALTFTSGGHYVCSLGEVLWGKLGDVVSEQVTPEMEIERIAKEIGKLDGDIKQNYNALAKEIVAVDSLREDLEARKAKLAEKDKKLQFLTEKLDSTDKVIVIGGKSLTREQVSTALAQDFELFKAEEAAVKAKEELLAKKQATVDAAKGKIEAMKAQQAKLTADLEMMKTELAKVREAQAQSSTVKLDDSRLSEIKESAKNLKAKIQVMQKEVDLQGTVATSPQQEVDQALKTEKALEELRERYNKKTANNP